MVVCTRCKNVQATVDWITLSTQHMTHVQYASHNQTGLASDVVKMCKHVWILNTEQATHDAHAICKSQSDRHRLRRGENVQTSVCACLTTKEILTLTESTNLWRPCLQPCIINYVRTPNLAFSWTLASLSWASITHTHTHTSPNFLNTSSISPLS